MYKNSNSYHLVKVLTITPDAKKIIWVHHSKILKISDLDTGKEISTLISHKDEITSLAITQNGKIVIFGSNNNTLVLLDLETKEEVANFISESPIICCAVAPDGVTIVAGEQSGKLHFLRLQGKVTDE